MAYLSLFLVRFDWDSVPEHGTASQTMGQRPRPWDSFRVFGTMTNPREKTIRCLKWDRFPSCTGFPQVGQGFPKLDRVFTKWDTLFP